MKWVARTVQNARDSSRQRQPNSREDNEQRRHYGHRSWYYSVQPCSHLKQDRGFGAAAGASPSGSGGTGLETADNSANGGGSWASWLQDGRRAPRTQLDRGAMGWLRLNRSIGWDS